MPAYVKDILLNLIGGTAVFGSSKKVVPKFVEKVYTGAGSAITGSGTFNSLFSSTNTFDADALDSNQLSPVSATRKIRNNKGKSSPRR